MLFNFKGVFIKGIITKIESKDYYVLIPESNEIIRCNMRGKFRKDFQLKKDKLYILDVAAVGDHVEFDLNKDGTGSIFNVEERKNYISRKAPKVKGGSYRGERFEQIIAANVDNLFIISSVKDPKFNNRSIDRFLVVAESSHITPIIIVNKIDLDKKNSMKDWIELYESIGYNVIRTSVKNNKGIPEIKNLLQNKTSIFWGHSGVGKSSILNSIYPDLNLKVGEISSYSLKGKHTTVTSVLKQVEPNTFIIDTPGIREIEPYGVSKQDLSHYFKEFLPYIEDCKFNTCTHFHEPECGVSLAVEEENISIERYESYLTLLDTIEDDLFF